MSRIVVLDGRTVNPGDVSWSPLEELGTLALYPYTPPELVAGRVQDAQVIVTNKCPIDAAVLDAAPALVAVCVTATGVNVVDLEAASARGIPVCNVPSYGTASVAEHTFALLFELYRNVALHNCAVHAGEWGNQPDFSFWKTPQLELAEKTLGIIGHGHIGSKVARLGLAFGMKVIATPSRSVPVPSDVGVADVDAIFLRADVVSLHCPLTPATHELVRWERLERMRRDAVLLNTARGGLVRELDLLRALSEGVIAGAGLDVLAEEPPRAESPLLSAPNCIITPHLAWASASSRTRLILRTAENVRAALAREPIHVVNPRYFGRKV